MSQQPIPNALRLYRKQAGLRQVDVAKKLGFVSTDRISYWENGLSLPSIANLFKLSALYNVSAHDLYQEFAKEVSAKMPAEEGLLTP